MGSGRDINIVENGTPVQLDVIFIFDAHPFFVFCKSSIRLKVLVVQILTQCLKGSFNYDKVLKLAADNADGVADIKVACASKPSFDIDFTLLSSIFPLIAGSYRCSSLHAHKRSQI